MKALNLACLLLALLSQLSACGRPDTGSQTRPGSSGVLSAALSNPWMTSPGLQGAELSLPQSESGSSPPGAPHQPALSSPDPDTRLAAVEAWVQSRPDSLHEIAPMLHDPDPSVRTRARALWSAALSGGRKADPD